MITDSCPRPSPSSARMQAGDQRLDNLLPEQITSRTLSGPAGRHAETAKASVTPAALPPPSALFPPQESAQFPFFERMAGCTVQLWGSGGRGLPRFSRTTPASKLWCLGSRLILYPPNFSGFGSLRPRGHRRLCLVMCENVPISLLALGTKQIRPGGVTPPGAFHRPPLHIFTVYAPHRRLNVLISI